jgi:hypothetical protein
MDGDAGSGCQHGLVTAGGGGPVLRAGRGLANTRVPRGFYAGLMTDYV